MISFNFSLLPFRNHFSRNILHYLKDHIKEDIFQQSDLMPHFKFFEFQKNNQSMKLNDWMRKSIN